MSDGTMGGDMGAWKTAAQSEWIVVGAMLHGGPATVWEVSEVLTDEDFTDLNLGIVFHLICELTAAGHAVDKPMLRSALASYIPPSSPISPDGYTNQIYESTFTASGARWHADRVRNAALMLRARGEIEALAHEARQHDGSAIEFIDMAQKRFLALDAAERKGTRGETAISATLPSVWDEMCQQYENPEDAANGLPTGLPTLDRYLQGGFKGGSVYILAARPSVGKTSLALSMAVHAAKRRAAAANDDGNAPGTDTRVQVFSLETPHGRLLKRMLFTEAEVDHMRLADRKLTPHDWDNLRAAKERLLTLRIDLHDDASMTMPRLERICRDAKATAGLDLVVVDYTQLLGTGETGQRAKNENRTQEISAITRGMKRLALGLDVPVLALSQLSRAIESRADKLPMLSDLRESGSIEQDADVVMFLYPFDMRGEIGNGANVPIGAETDANGSVGYALDLKKNRDGPTNKRIPLLFWPAYTKFGEMAFSEQY